MSKAVTLGLLIAWLGAAAACGGPHFVRMRAVDLGETEVATPNSGGAATAAYPNGPIRGYIRVRITTDTNGIATSWSDQKSRSLFKKLLLTFEWKDGGEEIPLASVDVTGGVAGNLKDVDIARLRYIDLDSLDRARPGTTTDVAFVLRVRAVPVTLADASDQLAAFGLSVIAAVPTGLPFTESVFDQGTKALVGAILGSIKQQANASKKKEWVFGNTYSLRSVLFDGPRTWVLMPERDDDTEGTDAYGNPVIKAPIEPPPLFACNEAEKLTGVLDHACIRVNERKYKLYTDHAWITLSVELFPEPASDMVSNKVCDALSSKERYAAEIGRYDAYNLSPTHQSELTQYRRFVGELHQVMTGSAPDRLAAYATVDVLREKMPYTAQAAPNFTWSTLNERVLAAEQCLKDWEAGVAVASLEKKSAKRLVAARKAIEESTALSASLLYEAVDSIYNALLSVTDDTARATSQLAKDLLPFERHLYSVAFENKDEATLRAALETYRHCNMCQTKGRDQLDRIEANKKPLDPIHFGAISPDAGIVGLIDRNDAIVKYNELRVDARIAAAKKDYAALKRITTELAGARGSADAQLKGAGVDPEKYLDR